MKTLDQDALYKEVLKIMSIAKYDDLHFHLPLGYKLSFSNAGEMFQLRHQSYNDGVVQNFTINNDLTSEQTATCMTQYILEHQYIHNAPYQLDVQYYEDLFDDDGNHIETKERNDRLYDYDKEDFMAQVRAKMQHLLGEFYPNPFSDVCVWCPFNSKYMDCDGHDDFDMDGESFIDALLDMREIKNVRGALKR